MIGSRSFFYEIVDTYYGTIKFGDDSRISIKRKGKILLYLQNGKTMSLSNVLYTL